MTIHFLFWHTKKSLSCSLAMADPAPMTERERQLTAENDELTKLVETLMQEKCQLQVAIAEMRGHMKHGSALCAKILAESLKNQQ
jgi:hypothetical protein